MNWADMDSAMLAHFRRLGAIRHAHPAIGSGRQTTIDTHTCVRTLDGDTVLIVLRPGRRVRVAPLFADGVKLTDLLTGGSAVVSGGYIRSEDAAKGVALYSPEAM